MTKPNGGSARDPPTGTVLFKDIGTLATFNEALGELKDAAIFVEQNVVRWVGSAAELPSEYANADREVSLANRVVIPGMVNTHHHMFQCITRCVAQDSKLFGWLTTLYEAWQHLSGEDVYTACKLAMAELILTGCTTTSDHLYLYVNDIELDDSIRAAREIGIRFHPTRGAMSLGKSKGGLPPDKCCEEEEAALVDMERLIETYHDTSKYAMLRIGLAPCSPFTVTTDLMVAGAALARRYEGVRLHTHLAENQEDIDYSLEVYGCRPGQYIKDVGWERDDVWFAHCCMLDEAETAQFAQHGIGLAHCPSSNMRLASGIAPVRKYLDAGVHVSLGVDGTASNDSGNMIAEARQAFFLQRSGGNVKGMEAREALKVGIQGGATNLGRDDIGQIAPGFAADFVAWRTDTLPMAGARIDPVAALVICCPGFVDLSVINGRIVVQDGKFTELDLQALVDDHNARSERICSYLPAWWKTGDAPSS